MPTLVMMFPAYPVSNLLLFFKLPKHHPSLGSSKSILCLLIFHVDQFLHTGLAAFYTANELSTEPNLVMCNVYNIVL